MARSATARRAGRERSMAHRVKQVLLRSAMGIMTGYAGRWSRHDLMMRGGKLRSIRFMALRAERSDLIHFQGAVIRTMGPMTGGAFLSRRGMGRAVTPVFGHLAMATQAERRLPLFHKGGVG